MHPSAMIAGQAFFEIYCAQGAGTIVDIGSQDVNGSLRGVAPANARYIGLDLAPGAGVDIVLQDPHTFPLATGSVDVVVSTSCFEHDSFFWLTFLEVARVLKEGGLFFLDAPSNGPYHTFPSDNWRFYPDAGKALAAWARRSGYRLDLVESFILNQIGDVWSDFVGVFRKGGVGPPRAGFLHSAFEAATNVWVHANTEVLKRQDLPEDLRKIEALAEQLGRARGLFTPSRG